MDLPFLKLDLSGGGRGPGLDESVIAETERLVLRRIALTDAPFLLRQLNEPSWLKNIGDKGVKTLADAEKYVRAGPMESMKKHGFGMSVMVLKATQEPVGVCGLVRRETLPEPDIGFALLESEFGKGYALEAAGAVMRHARDALGIRKLLAITTPSNERSGKLLLKLGFRFQGMVRLTPQAEELKLYSWEA